MDLWNDRAPVDYVSENFDIRTTTLRETLAKSNKTLTHVTSFFYLATPEFFWKIVERSLRG